MVRALTIGLVVSLCIFIYKVYLLCTYRLCKLTDMEFIDRSFELSDSSNDP